MKQIILILLIFIIGCEPKEEKINLETFLIGDIWCNDKLKTGKICFEFTSGSVIITGLPFASLASSGDAYVSGNVAWYKRMALNSNVDQVAVEIGQGASQFSFICSSSGNAWTDAVHSAGNNFYLRASATYPTAS